MQTWPVTIRPRRCKSCRQQFTPARQMQSVCSPDCAHKLVRAKAEAKDREQTKMAKQRLKPRSQWMKEAQAAFNRWVRLRDAKEPCISCQRHHEGQYHAGHYLSTGAKPELRFEPENVHKQCSACNSHLSGNIVLYRRNLIAKIGQDRVDWLEGPHDPKKWTIEQLREIRDRYRLLVKVLERGE